ncbi:MAG: hypothetical protein IJ660_07075 [Alphaproteobacteria bacterium]|nr:hypothetical protein [Alphaproteobacteria bacterium]
MNKFKKIIARILVTDPIKRGKEVWNHLYEGEEKPIGWQINDEPKVKKFVQKAKALSFLDYYALTTWLKFAYDDLEKNMPEHTTGAIEQYHDKWCQIYRQHLEALEKLDTCK